MREVSVDRDRRGALAVKPMDLVGPGRGHALKAVRARSSNRSGQAQSILGSVKSQAGEEGASVPEQLRERDRSQTDGP